MLRFVPESERRYENQRKVGEKWGKKYRETGKGDRLTKLNKNE